MEITPESVGSISQETLKHLNRIISGELKARQAKKISEVKSQLMVGDPVICNHPKLSFHDKLYITSISRKTAVIEDRSNIVGPFDSYQTYKVTMSLLSPVS
jgi:hypothetical protein